MTREVVIRITIPDGAAVPDIAYIEDDGPPLPPEPSKPSELPWENRAKPSQPSCQQHGPMVFKKGTNKAGKDWAGHFCQVEGCETKPVWAKA